MPLNKIRFGSLCGALALLTLAGAGCVEDEPRYGRGGGGYGPSYYSGEPAPVYRETVVVDRGRYRDRDRGDRGYYREDRGGSYREDRRQDREDRRDRSDDGSSSRRRPSRGEDTGEGNRRGRGDSPVPPPPPPGVRRGNGSGGGFVPPPPPPGLEERRGSGEEAPPPRRRGRGNDLTPPNEQ